MKHTIDQSLINAKPESIDGNSAFINRTMHAVAKASTDETFNKVLRTTKDSNKGTLRMKLHNVKLRFNKLPRFAAVCIIIGSTGTVGAAAYATYRWITPKVNITNIQQVNDDNKKQYTIDSQCGDFYSGKALQYELSRSSKLTDDDVNKVFKNTCAYVALSTFIDSHWISDNGHDEFAKKKVGDIVTIYQHDNLFAGGTESNPIFGLTIGKVTEINVSKVSISLPLYAVHNLLKPDESLPYDYYPNGKVFSRTLSLSPDVEVWSEGKLVKLADVKPGDTVQVVTRTQNKVQYYDDIKQNALGQQIKFDVVGLIRTSIDTKYVSGAGGQIGDPAITNALASLIQCDNNPDYSCVIIPNQILGPVYGVGDDPNGNNNTRYQRKDIMDDKKVKNYRLHGRIMAIDGTHVTLQTRGKKQSFTVDLPYDAVTQYNTPKPGVNDHDKSVALKVAVGDLIDVMYAQSSQEDHLAVKSGDLQSFAVLEQIQPDGSITKY